MADARDASAYLGCRYDAVVCTEVLEHIGDDVAVVAQFPEGVVCICTVPSVQDPGHVRWFVSSSEAKQRYGPWCNDFSVVAFRSPCSADDTFYLLLWRRNTSWPTS